MCTLKKLKKILRWARHKKWFDESTMKSIYDQRNTDKYDWPTVKQEEAVNNVYKKCVQRPGGRRY